MSEQNRFKIGDKVYSKKGAYGEEIGVVNKVDGEIITVRLFENSTLKEEFHDSEVYTQGEHDTKVAELQEKHRASSEAAARKWSGFGG